MDGGRTVFLADMKRFGWFFLAAWTLIIGIVLYWDFQRGQLATREIALSQARAHFNKDLAFRLWATDHQHIYVPVTEKLLPDPNLSHIEERDLTTPSGRQLTMINPARMIRQLNREYELLYGVAGRIVSLQPIREENAPDEWERAALLSFQEGETEVLAFTKMEEEPSLRLMRPLETTERCLACHAQQGYRVGFISGGIGVTVPMGNLLLQERQRLQASSLSLISLWLIGLLLMGTTFYRLAVNQSKRERALQRLARTEARKASIMEAALDSIVIMDNLGRIAEFNPAAERTFGYQRHEVIGRDLAEVLVPPSLRELHKKGIRNHIATRETRMLNTRIQTMALHADGREFPVELTVTRVEHERQPFFTAYIRDMTQARQLEEQITFKSTHDQLTGLLNRSEFERRLALLLREHKFDDDTFALIVIDLDQFKVINDTGGHDAGDRLLIQIGGLLYSKTRAGDSLARLGGNEFGIVLAQCSLEQAHEFSTELLEAIRRFRYQWEGKNFAITASIGIVPVFPNSQSISDVLSAADTACHVAKEQGRNRIHLFRHDDVDLARRQGEMRWVSKIHDAFENGRFYLYSQQLKSLSDDPEKQALHYEVLLRMRDENGEFVPPVTFLSAAERYSLMPTIDRWVVRSTFSFLANHPLHLQQLAMCSINLSGHSVTDSAFLSFLLEELRRYALPAERICFEITETAAVSNLSKATHFIEKLRKYGCRFALDDFGSGMSSFAYLKNLPVDFLKIDGAFVRDIVDDEIDFAMVRSINDIGHVMGKQTIAEFVENDSIISRLQEIGVDFAQGYGVAIPSPLEQLALDQEREIDMAG